MLFGYGSRRYSEHVCMGAVFPLVSDELISRLEAAFGRKPDASTAHREIDHWIGEQRVIDCIKRWHAEQQEGLG